MSSFPKVKGPMLLGLETRSVFQTLLYVIIT